MIMAIRMPKPVLTIGATGPAVSYMQSLLPHGFDGDFGPITDEEVREFQRTRGLPVTGIVEQATWNALESHALPVMPALPASELAGIMWVASTSEIANYNWADRGVAPEGYISGMAVTFAQSVLRLRANFHPAVIEMACGNKHDDDIDALSWLNSDFAMLGMSNERPGIDTLRHLYVLLLGLGMRESGGYHCEGRDLSADNTSSDTAEAGLFQTSYNAHVCHETFDPLMDEFEEAQRVLGFGTVFAQGVTCSESDWDNYGSGRGHDFQRLCKNAPAFAVESCALTLRNLRQHYGPINRREVELRREADDMFRAVQMCIGEI
jgi:hypothetical protein